MDADVQLRYSNKLRTLKIKLLLQHLSNTHLCTRPYSTSNLKEVIVTGKSNVVFASDIPATNNADYTTFALTLSVALGDFVYGGTISNSITITGTSSDSK